MRACRLAGAISRMSATYQQGLLTLQRKRTGGNQHVTVKHIHQQVNVTEGGQAVVAGDKVTGRTAKAGRGEKRWRGMVESEITRERKLIERLRARLEALVKANAAPRCGARSKRTGKPCRAAAMPNGRCKLHGGKSTGTRTPEGLERSRRANWKHGYYSREANAAPRCGARSKRTGKPCRAASSSGRRILRKATSLGELALIDVC